MREKCGAIREIGCGKPPGHKGPHWWDDATPDELAAAEERGRRAGIEERDELRELLRNVRPLIREEFLRAGAMTERGWEKFLARVDAALAPRDSGRHDSGNVCGHGFQRDTSCVYCRDRK